MPPMISRESHELSKWRNTLSTFNGSFMWNIEAPSPRISVPPMA